MDASTTSIAEAQADMRFAYRGGAPGVLVSATVWLVAGLVSWLVSPGTAVWTLLIGGMFIHPAAVLVTKLAGRSAAPSPGNPLGSLALATTFWLVLSLPLAYVVSLARVEWFFAAMLLVIGGRYTTFATLYGERLFWLAGAGLALAGVGVAWSNAGATAAALTGAVLEGALGAFLWARREVRQSGSSEPEPVGGSA